MKPTPPPAPILAGRPPPNPERGGRRVERPSAEGRVPLPLLSVCDHNRPDLLTPELLAGANAQQKFAYFEAIDLAGAPLPELIESMYGEPDPSAIRRFSELRRECLQQGVHALVLDINPVNLARVISLLRQSFGKDVVVAVVVDPESDAITSIDCMRAGADALLPQPITADAIGGLWQHCMRLNPTPF